MRRAKRLPDRLRVLAALLAVGVLLVGCHQVAVTEGRTPASESPETAQEEGNEKIMQQIEIRAGKSVYTAVLYENDTAQAFTTLLPMQVTMQELNGNEKYVYLPQSLPENAQSVSSIQAGDLMLFGSDCVVLFYEDFSTTYRYTRIGYIENPDGLAQALGSDTATVTFQAESDR